MGDPQPGAKNLVGLHVATAPGVTRYRQNTANLARLSATEAELGLQETAPAELAKEVGRAEDLLRLPPDEGEQGVQRLTDNEREGDPGPRTVLRSARTCSPPHLTRLPRPPGE